MKTVFNTIYTTRGIFDPKSLEPVFYHSGYLSIKLLKVSLSVLVMSYKRVGKFWSVSMSVDTS